MKKRKFESEMRKRSREAWAYIDKLRYDKTGPIFAELAADAPNEKYQEEFYRLSQLAESMQLVLAMEGMADRS